MALAIEVYRDAGDRPGDEIREDLLGDSLEAALARGRGELDANAHATTTTTLELVAPRLDLRLGDLIGVSDPAQGVEWRGKIVGIRHTQAVGEAPTVLTLERAT
jgi:hypothetical protein